MRISLLKLATAPLALAIASVPAHAANPTMGGADGAKGEAAILEMFAKLFDNGDKTPIDPAQLALGQATAARLLPEGAYGTMMDKMLGTFMKPILALDPGMSASQVVFKTGMDQEAANALTEDDLKAIQAILDPGRQARTDGVLDVVRPMMVEAGKMLEGPMREGIARAYARKFSAAQLAEMNRFFATPTGSAYAAESFAIQYDPEVMSATMQALPVMMTKLMGSATDLEAKMKALPQERKISELSETELAHLSMLVGISVAEIKEYDAMMAEVGTSSASADAPADAAAAAAADAADAATPSDGSEPWNDRANWSAADLATVEALEAKASEAISAQIDAEDTAAANARKRLRKK